MNVSQLFLLLKKKRFWLFSFLWETLRNYAIETIRKSGEKIFLSVKFVLLNKFFSVAVFRLLFSSAASNFHQISNHTLMGLYKPMSDVKIRGFWGNLFKLFDLKSGMSMFSRNDSAVSITNRICILQLWLIRNGVFNFSRNTIIASCWMWLSQLFLPKR